MYDLIICGAGPAGSTLAKFLGGNLRVLLLEKRPLDRPHEAGDGTKCCGGLLAPDAQRAFAACGYALDNEALASPQTFLVRALDLQSGISRAYQRHYINMDREAFDRFLFDKADACEKRTGCVVKDVRRIAEGFEIEFVCAGRRCVEKGRMLACADGAGSILRRKLDPKSVKTPLYAAIQQEIALEEPEAFYGSYFDNTLTDYYAWTIPKDGAILFGAAVAPGADAREKFEQLKARLIEKGVPLSGKVLKTHGALLRRPQRFSQIVPTNNGAFFLGECGGFISPSSAEGLSYAIKTGRLCAMAILQSAGDRKKALREYRRSCLPLRIKLAVKIVKGRVLYHPLTRQIAMKSGLTAIDTAQ